MKEYIAKLSSHELVNKEQVMEQRIAQFEFAKQSYQVDLVPQQHADRQNIEHFIHAVYEKRYQADVQAFMPMLVKVSSVSSGKTVAAAGFTLGHRNKLFLEQYLDFPLEKAASAVIGKQMKRSDFVEVGNLAGAIPGAAHLIILSLAEYLSSIGHQWIAFTLTKSMVNAFQAIGLEPLALIDAHHSSTSTQCDDWGSYFETQPKVMVGAMALACEKMHQMGLYKKLKFQNFYSSSFDQQRVIKQGASK